MVTHALRPLRILISITQSIFVPSFTLFTESAQFCQIPELAAPLLIVPKDVTSQNIIAFLLGDLLNPFTLRVALESIVCYSHIFGNNLEIKLKFTKYLKESCCLTSDRHFSFKCFLENAFVSKIFPKLSGLFWPLCQCKWVKKCLLDL